MNTTKYPAIFTRGDLKNDSAEILERKISALLRAMTLEEKLSMLGGAREPESKGKIGNAGYQRGIPRLGVPEVVMYDGPAGITGIVETTGLPCPALLGSTWDDSLAYAFGKIAAAECAACSGNFLLAPQLDVIRSPHFYRNKDMKSEDSFLCARMGAAEVKGVQEAGVVATVKHFTAANLFGDDLNHFPGQLVDEQTLHETYCRPFEAAVGAGAGSVMNAYNKINGSFASANRDLLQDILREQWGFAGSVMSDWGSVHEFALDRGLDLEMPFPAFHSAERVKKRLESGALSMQTLDGAIRHILTGMGSVGLLGLVELDEEGTVKEEPGRTAPIEMAWRYDRMAAEGMLERHGEIAAEIVRKGIVLLKNEKKALPLKGKGKTVLIGLGAKYPICGEAQERSFGVLRRMRSGQEALEELAGQSFLAYPGVDYMGQTIPTRCLFRDADCTRPGLVRTYGILDEDRDPVGAQIASGGGGAAFEGGIVLDENGVEVDTGLTSYNSRASEYPPDYPLGKLCAVDAQIDFTCGTKTYRNGEDGSAFTNGECFTWKGFLKAPETGEYSLILQCVGGEASFFIRTEEGWRMPGQSQIREWTQWPWESIICTPEGMGVTSQRVKLQAGKVYPVLLHARHCVKNKDLQLRLAWATPGFAEENLEKATRAAAEADTIVFYACDSTIGARASDKRFTENHLELSDEQTHLLQRIIGVKKPGSKLIVILQTANAKAIGGWAERADAILASYMPGQEGGRVLAEILLGKINPSGKLIQSWPRCPEDTPLTDTPAHEQERLFGVDGVVTMSEGIFTGYRWYDKAGIEPLFPFGHGLSYTRFAYSDLTVDGMKATFSITNVGSVAGDEIAQLYLGEAAVPAHIQMAKMQLAGYIRVQNILPGQARRVSIPVEERMLCYWDPRKPLRRQRDGTLGKWVRPAGKRKIYIGASSRDIRLKGEITIEEETT